MLKDAASSFRHRDSQWRIPSCSTENLSLSYLRNFEKYSLSCIKYALEYQEWVSEWWEVFILPPNGDLWHDTTNNKHWPKSDKDSERFALCCLIFIYTKESIWTYMNQYKDHACQESILLSELQIFPCHCHMVCLQNTLPHTASLFSRTNGYWTG